ncbi:MAG: DUF421 domain-containing protein [Oscillospiraceae bacterium]|nr:DUF421 domain-containing protein [Oscillospiraceae bacterium]
MLAHVWETVVHAAVSIGALFILTRLMGKKQIAQLTLFDYIIGISIGSIAAEGAIDPGVPLPVTLSALVVFSLFSIIFSYVSLKSYTGRKILEGNPVVLIENGMIIESGLKKARLNINELLEECRQKNAFNLSDIEFAILETSGRLSVLMKSCRQPLTPEDMQIDAAYQGICTGVIIEGKVLQRELSILRKDETWLEGELQKQGINGSDKVLLAYTDSAGNLVAYKRYVTPSSPPLT